MRNILAIYERDLKSYFNSQIFYIIAGVFVFVIGYVFRTGFLQFAADSMSLLRMIVQHGDANLNLININGVSLKVFNYINFMMLLIVPMLTMRLYAEERRNGTMELLLTSPITTFEVLMGKFASCFTIYSIMVLLTSVFMLLLALFSKGQLDLGPIVASYIGTLFLGMALIPIGMFCSSLTENQIVASFTALTISLGLWLLLISAQFFAYPMNEVIAFISLSEHLDALKLGYVGIRHFVYFLSMSLFWLVLTWMSVESARWRQ